MLEWVETTGSDSKLPNIPNFEKRPFDVDPKKSLGEVLHGKDGQPAGENYMSGTRGSQRTSSDMGTK
jgi:hypothetical protein